jgi:hypothetical protein
MGSNYKYPLGVGGTRGKEVRNWKPVGIYGVFSPAVRTNHAITRSKATISPCYVQISSLSPAIASRPS